MNVERDLARNAVIVFADLQEGIVDHARTNDAATIARAARALGKLARIRSIPVVTTTIPIGSGKLINEIAEFGPPLVRTRADAFAHVPFREAVEATGCRELLICGVASEIVVQMTALSGLRRGYAVQVVVDAGGGRSERTERAAFDRVQQAGGVLTSVAGVIAELLGDFSDPVGGQVAAVLQEFSAH